MLYYVKYGINSCNWTPFRVRFGCLIITNIFLFVNSQGSTRSPANRSYMWRWSEGVYYLEAWNTGVCCASGIINLYGTVLLLCVHCKSPVSINTCMCSTSVNIYQICSLWYLNYGHPSVCQLLTVRWRDIQWGFMHTWLHKLFITIIRPLLLKYVLWIIYLLSYSDSASSWTTLLGTEWWISNVSPCNSSMLYSSFGWCWTL